MQGNFLDMPFERETFDAAYAIEATCHANKVGTPAQPVPHPQLLQMDILTLLSRNAGDMPVEQHSVHQLPLPALPWLESEYHGFQ